MPARLALQRAIARLFHWRWSHPLMAAMSRLVVRRHRVGVLVVLFNGQGEVLLLRPVFHTTSAWGIPGGWLKRGETPQQGALRELREETGLAADLGPVVHLSLEPEPSHIPIVFAGRAGLGSLRLSFESTEARWCSSDDLPDSLDPFFREAIRRAVRWRHGAQETAGPPATG